ncbi:hypothetical protein VNO77_36801 [Canavalia gladiata]|uniref:Uncharacterized protein n=1 Tax=Canavalia gladiata TaxID=3824 RepID=A0AAN9KA55_CANGL
MFYFDDVAVRVTFLLITSVLSGRSRFVSGSFILPILSYLTHLILSLSYLILILKTFHYRFRIPIHSRKVNHIIWHQSFGSWNQVSSILYFNFLVLKLLSTKYSKKKKEL